MNEIVPMSSHIAAEAERRRAELSATAASLRVNLAPGNLFEEAKSAAGKEAGSVWDASRRAVASHPVAAAFAAAGAAVIVGTSMKKKAGGPDMAKLATAGDGAKSAPSLRGRVAEGLGALAQTSFQLAQDRYAQKARAFETAAKDQVRSLTEEVLVAGESAIAALLAALVVKLKPPAPVAPESTITPS